MEDFDFRKKLILNEIETLKAEFKKNQEFINLFFKKNQDLLKSMESYHKQLNGPIANPFPLGNYLKNSSRFYNKNVWERNFKKGQKVEIVGNIPFELKNKPKPLLGTVTEVDGAYILVRPKYSRMVAEFYPNELIRIGVKN
jgi:hypothetical protein